MSKGLENNRNSNYKVTQIFDFDGLLIEVINRTTPNHEDCEKKIASQTIFEPVSIEKCFEKCETQKSSPMSTSQSFVQPQPVAILNICALCLNYIDRDEQVILQNCQCCFCRACLMTAIIDNASDVIVCPSKFGKSDKIIPDNNCDEEISDNELSMILGEEYFYNVLIRRLDQKFKSLVEKDETEFQSM